MPGLSNFLELTKPKLSSLVMITVLVGWASAAPFARPPWTGPLLGLLFIALVAMGASALNCYVERGTDALMERTRHRALPSGRLSPHSALGFGLALLGLGLPALYFVTNPLTAALAALAAFSYVLAYTPLKRFGPSALFVGALPGALPPVLGRTAVTGILDATVLKLFALLFVWQIPHFLALSFYYARDYQRASLPVYGNTWAFGRLAWATLLFTLLLGALSVWPAAKHTNTAYLPCVLLLNAFFLLLSLAAFWASDVEKKKLWARAYFIGSLFYLPLLLGIVIFFEGNLQDTLRAP